VGAGLVTAMASGIARMAVALFVCLPPLEVSTPMPTPTSAPPTQAIANNTATEETMTATAFAWQNCSQNDSTADLYNDSCGTGYYDDYPSECSYYDDEDFTAYQQCCGCAGHWKDWSASKDCISNGVTSSADNQSCSEDVAFCGYNETECRKAAAYLGLELGVSWHNISFSSPNQGEVGCYMWKHGYLADSAFYGLLDDGSEPQNDSQLPDVKAAKVRLPGTHSCGAFAPTPEPIPEPSPEPTPAALTPEPIPEHSSELTTTMETAKTTVTAKTTATATTTTTAMTSTTISTITAVESSGNGNAPEGPTPEPTAEPTPMPTAEPAQADTSTTTAETMAAATTAADGGTKVVKEVVQVIDMEIAIDDVQNFDVKVFEEQLITASNLSSEEVEIEVEFAVKAKFSISEAVSEEECVTAVAAASVVDPAQVTCTIFTNSTRRLSPATMLSARRLAAVNVEVEIKTEYRVDVPVIKESVANRTKLAEALQKTTGKPVLPTVTEAPTSAVKVITKVTTPASKPADGNGDNETPQPLTFSSEALASISGAVGGVVEVKGVVATVEERMVTEPPTSVPTAAPTPAEDPAGSNDTRAGSSGEVDLAAGLAVWPGAALAALATAAAVA